MTPTAQEMAEESSKKLAGELMTLLAFKKDSATVEDFCKVLTKHLTTFAQAREQAVSAAYQECVEALQSLAKFAHLYATSSEEARERPLFGQTLSQALHEALHEATQALAHAKERSTGWSP